MIRKLTVAVVFSLLLSLTAFCIFRFLPALLANEFFLSPMSDGLRREWFIYYVEAIADSAPMTKPKDMSRFLHMHFKLTHTDDAEDGKCAAPGATADTVRRVVAETLVPDGDHWFKAMPGRMPPADGQPPRLRHFVTNTFTCGGKHKQDPAVHVEDRFDNIPGFVCITADQLASILHRAGPVEGTHGSSAYRYFSRVFDIAGIVADFTFTGGPCLQSATVELDEKHSRKNSIRERLMQRMQDQGR